LKKWLCLLIGWIVLVAPASAKKFELFVNTDTFIDSRPMAVASFVGGWDRNFSGGSSALAFSWNEMGIGFQGWLIGMFWRQDSYLRFHPDTAEFYYLTENKKPLEYGRDYNIDLSVKHNNSQGFRIRRQLVDRSDFKFTVGLSYLQAAQLFYGRLTGKIVAKTENDYDFDNVQLDYMYYDDKLFDRYVEAPIGNGYTADVSVFFQLNNRISLTLHVTDIYSRIRWRDVPATRAQLTSDNKTYDENGYVNVDPALQGRHSQQNYTQSLPMRSALTLSAAMMANTFATIDVLATSVKTFFSPGLQYALTQKKLVKLYYRVNTKALGFSFSNSWFALNMSADSLRFKQAKNITMSGSISLSFF